MFKSTDDREKRRTDRSTGLEVVEIEVAGCPDRHLGVIRDRSAQGARIQVRDAGRLPPKVKLFSPSIGDGVTAKVCWQRDGDIGIRFGKHLF